jgi:hypothetical protein
LFRCQDGEKIASYAAIVALDQRENPKTTDNYRPDTGSTGGADATSSFSRHAT